MPLDALSDRPGRLTDAVHRELRAAVLNGDPAPGQQLSVPELARRLGVSRGSVREAVLGLVADGLAEERPRRGVVVAIIGAAELRQIHQIREALEGQAARLGAAAATPEALAELAELLERQRRAIATGDGPGYAHTDERFHARLAEASGNPMLAALVGRLRSQMALALHRLAHDSEEHRERGCAELAEVLAAVRSGDPDAAEAAMRAHIRRTMTRLEGN